jgi:membrane associated rhomboid family serine protease
MFPVADVVPARRTPWTTLAFIGVTAAAFAWEAMLAETSTAGLRRVAISFGVVPGDVTPVAVLTSLALHPGWVPVVSNLLALWLFGGTVENRIGRVLFVLLYLGAGAIARLVEASVTTPGGLPLAGAGGAVAAIGGAYLALFPSSKVLVLFPLIVRTDIVEVPASGMIAVWALFQFAGPADWLGAVPLSSNVSLVGIAVGFGLGAATGFATRRRAPAARPWD